MQPDLKHLPPKIKKNVQHFEVKDLSVVRTDKLISRFPTTRYYGSKKRLLHWIYESIKDLHFNTVLDGFGGTASVSLLFKSMGKTVTFNDALMCNAVSARALLSNNSPFSNKKEVDIFFDSIIPEKGFIYKQFKNKFYLDSENAWLDGAVKAINQQPKQSKDFLFYCLFQASLQKRPFNLFHRANLNIRTNKTVERTFGNKTTWDTPFPDLAKRAFNELDKTIWRATNKAKVLPPTDISLIPSGYDLVYLDPPYISQKSTGEDYQRLYHFLEGLTFYDDWENNIDFSYNNLQLKKKQCVSSWHNKITFKEQLFNLIQKHSTSIVVLSYVRNAFPDIDEIEQLFKLTFHSYQIKDYPLSHALSKNKKSEVLFIGKPK